MADDVAGPKGSELSEWLGATQQIQDLEAVERLLTPEGAWCRGSQAKDSKGFPVRPNSKDAVSWCLNGAISKVLYLQPDFHCRGWELLDLLRSHTFSASVTILNDRSTHEEVLRYLHGVIANMKRRHA